MNLFKITRWAAILALSVLVAGCAKAAPSEDPAPDEAVATVSPDSEAAPIEDPASDEAVATVSPDSEAAGSEDQILIERTPKPTATPGPVTLALTEFAESRGLSNEVILGLTVDDWIDLSVSILIVVAGYALGSLIVRMLISRVARRFPPPFDSQVKINLGARLRQLILIYLLRVATIRLTFLGAALKRTLTDLYFVIGLIVVTQIALYLIDLTKSYYEESLDPPDRKAQMAPILSLLRRAAYLVVIVLAVSTGLARFGINMTALAAGLGIAGLGLALAAQDTIADAIAGMLILADQPFRVGDRIEIEAVNTWGDVVEIGMRTTRIRTRDNRLVIIPNSTVSKNEVINYSYPDPQYRIQTHVGIANGTDIEKARQLMIETVRNVDGVLQDKPVEALYIEMAEFDMRFRVRWWIESFVDTRRMLDSIHTALQNALDEAGIEMPFPTQELVHRFSADQERQLSGSLKIHETRRKPQASNTPPTDAESDDSDSEAKGE